MAKQSSRARMFHNIADELGVAPELVGAIAVELKLRSKESIIQAVRERIAAQAKQDEPTQPKAASTPKKKKSGLTLSQRRALLRLLDADIDGVCPQSAFKALPYDYLESIGYAERQVDGEGDDAVTRFVLTDEGRERAESINPGYRDWSAGETVVIDPETGEPVVRDEDGNPIRAPHGTHRRTKAEQAAAKAKAEAEAKAKADAEQAAKDAESTEDEAKEVVTA